MSASARPPPKEIAVGDVLDRYEIVRHVARGGMGSVWLARFAGKHGFSKQVAIKTILPELASDVQFRSMFLDEARISSRLTHANVAQVLDVGEHGGTVYIVFEWVEGRSLEELCVAAVEREEDVPIPLLLRIVADASAGLHAAHELTGDDGHPLNLVHRDVTPSNILVSQNGFAKVIDFGIAKTRDRVAGETRSGFVKGTPQYMAPEAAFRSPLDRRADVWSLGAVLFRALSGAPPFADLQAMLSVFDGVAKLPELPPNVPPDVRGIVKRAMHLDKGKRFPTADELRKALERALHGTGASSEEIGEAASVLVSTPRTTKRDRADAHAATELAMPSTVPRPITVGSDPPGGTLVSPGVPARRERQAPRRADPVRVLSVVVLVAGLVTAIAAALAFCSG